ncbi:MAG: response regulator [Desulfosalsimonadaceae bacterium]
MTENNKKSGSEILQQGKDSRQGMAVVSQDSRILYCNRQFADIVNASSEQLKGARITDVVQKDDRDRLDAFLARAHQQEQISARFCFNHAGGEKISYSTYMHSFTVGDLRAVCLVVENHDKPASAHMTAPEAGPDQAVAQTAGGPPEKRTYLPIKIMLADDHAVMRQGLAMLLSNYDDIQVTGEASDGKEAVKLARELNPDVILMDISMPEMNGIEATRIIKAELPHIRIIGLSMFDATDQAEAIWQAGASQYLKKHGDKHELLNTIRDASVNSCS